MEYLDDSVYDGDFDKGLKDGVGVMDYANGEQYDGDWSEDKYHGKGTFYLRMVTYMPVVETQLPSWKRCIHMGKWQ